ncbi:MAG: putative DNA-binding protein YlxM (UPF0122 family) [Sulfurimonas sp.]|jgi:predicted DNA-binding protein YlxM (UPF0122 family)
MTNVESRVYIAMLEILKGSKPFNVSAVARKSQVSRQAIYNILERRTYQDLDKYKAS